MSASEEDRDLDAGWELLPGEVASQTAEGSTETAAELDDLDQGWEAPRPQRQPVEPRPSRTRKPEPAQPALKTPAARVVPGLPSAKKGKRLLGRRRASEAAGGDARPPVRKPASAKNKHKAKNKGKAKGKRPSPRQPAQPVARSAAKASQRPARERSGGRRDAAREKTGVPEGPTRSLRTKTAEEPVRRRGPQHGKLPPALIAAVLVGLVALALGLVRLLAR